MWVQQLIVASLLGVSLANSVRYIVISPRTVRPAMVYNMAAMVTSEELEDVFVHASISCDNQLVAESTAVLPTNTLNLLPVRVAMSISPGNYSLNVEVKNKGMVLFRNSSELVFDPRFLSIVVQTSRPIYRAGQEVRFRVVTLQTDLKPFNDGLEIYVLDPDGLIMRRWLSAYTNNGVSSKRFKLPKLVKDGYWKIRVKAWNQIVEQMMRVETYFDPLFEVHVTLPPYITQTVESIVGSVCGRFPTQRLVEGNGTVTLYARKWKNDESFNMVWTEDVFFKGKEHPIQIPTELISSKLGSLDDIEVKLHASITELLSLERVEGFSHSRLISKDIHLRFLCPSPATFKPGFPFYCHIAVFHDGNEKIPQEILKSSRLRIKGDIEEEGGQRIRLSDIIAGSGFENTWNDEENYINDKTKENFVDELSNDNYLQEGVLHFSFDTSNNTRKLSIKALFVSEEGTSVEAALEAVSYFSSTTKFISVSSSSRNLNVDEFAIFHVKSNFRMDSFQYIVVSKSEILLCGEQTVEGSSVTSTFSLSLSRRMAPGFRLLVYHITTDGQLLSDSVFLPVDGFHKYNTELEVHTGKDHKSERVEARVSGGEGAFIGIHATRAPAFNMQAGHEISLGRLVEQFMLLDNSRNFNKMRWKSQDGTTAAEVNYYMMMDDGLNTNHTFTSAGLNLFTSEDIQQTQAMCDAAPELPCDANSCYPANKTCDGEVDCTSGFDEIACLISDEVEYKYKITRTSRNEFLYDMREGDWGWREIKVNDHEGVEFEPLIAPQTADDWYFTAFSINNDYGFSIIPEPIVFSSRRHLMMHMNGPSSCYAGEQIGLQVDLFNHHHSEALVVLTLKGSPLYKFVHVEAGGSVSSYSARLSSGDHQLLVYMPPESQQHIDFPVVPTVQQGQMEVTVVCTAQTGSIERTLTITVHGGGAMINKHTSVFLDLKNRALVMSYLDIIVEESPIIPYNMTRRYVYGSTSASIELFGDIIGPVFSSVPATMESTLKTSAKGTLARVFEFGVNIWTLHYLRLTNKLQRPFLKEVLFECNAIYAQIIKRFNIDGSFRNWDSSGFSVWLTAWVLQMLKAASYPDWEFLLFLDPSIPDRSITWLLQFQAPNGSFVEPYPDIDSKLNSQTRHISLTAHVLLTLCQCMSMLSGEIKIRAAVASGRAATYLERLLGSLSDPHLLAVSVYALSVGMGADVELGYHRLMQAQRTNSEGFIFWSPRDIAANPMKKENQRPFLRPRQYQEQDSVAVETTSWVLLILLHREGVTDTAERIVKWLNSVKMTSGGFISPVDTLIAIQSLTEYAFRARLHEITNMDVTIELPTSDNLRTKVHIDNSTVLFQSHLQIPKVWGNVIIQAQGAGQAVAQLDVNYGIDHEMFVEVPTLPSFDLNITEYYSTFRNKSALTIQSCLRWLRDDPPTSSAATLEIDSPTGYSMVESEAEVISRLGTHPTLRDGHITYTRSLWFFEKVEKHWTCFNFTLKRWFPVANITLHRQALLYEATARERFVQVVFNSTPLHVLNICEVCGSYQCPYCPHYSSATLQSVSLYIATVSLLLKTIISSIHDEDPSFDVEGYFVHGLSYTMYATSLWLAPSVVCLTGPRLGMFLAATGYTYYVLAFTLEKEWAIYSAAIFMGFCAAVLWTSENKYLLSNSTPPTRTRNISIFWFFYSSSEFYGNLIIYFQLAGKRLMDGPTRHWLLYALTAMSCVALVLLLLLRHGGNTQRQPPTDPVKALRKTWAIFLSRDVRMLSLTFCYVGLAQAFAFGVYSPSVGFTLAFGNNAKQLVALSGIFLGMGEMICGGLQVVLSKRIHNHRHGRSAIVVFGFTLHLVAYACIYINLPNSAVFGNTDDPAYINSSVYLAILSSLMLGLADCSLNTQVYSLLAAMYPENGAETSALYKFAKAVVKATSFYSSNHLGLHTHLHILITLAFVGVVAFLVSDNKLECRRAEGELLELGKSDDNLIS
ncbi:CD109 antigen-like [Macrosteles quadrilineatus]|uniref:CD109 antigen-like n=1 Tax=Macrosteles quadrilineatus TaxID=74068 RepID=UPI0023E0AFED|nr:CD109 antigen-like [Macrosteles quadrilineatus]